MYLIITGTCPWLWVTHPISRPSQNECVEEVSSERRSADSCRRDVTGRAEAPSSEARVVGLVLEVSVSNYGCFCGPVSVRLAKKFKCAGKYFGGEIGVMEELNCDAGSKSDPLERGSSKC